MRSTTASFAILLAVPSAVYAVTLSDFTPRVDGLSSACESVYTTDISGCSASDFGNSGKGCSSGCISGLQSLVGPVQMACGNSGISGNNVLAAFLAGNGVHMLCANTPAATPSTSQAPTTSNTPTQAPSPSSTPPPATSSSSTLQQPTTSDTPSTSSTSSTQAVSTSPAAVTITSSSSSSTKASSSKSAASSSSSSSAADAFALVPTTSASSVSSSSKTTTALNYNPTNPNDGSGGGSPFDTAGNMRSEASFAQSPILPAFITMLLALAVMV